MTIEDIQSKIRNNNATMLYFSGEDCGVCHALMPKIKESFSSNFPKIEQIYISASQYPQIAASFSVFTIPTIIVFFDGKEFIKKSRHISVSGLNEEIQRPYGLFFD